MATSILLVFEKNNQSDPREQSRWLGLSNNMKNLANSNKDVQILGENCLTLPIDRGLDIFHDVLHNSLGVSYKYAILPEGLEWHAVTK
jgi:hypothetical protein